MFGATGKRKIAKYTRNAAEYLQQTFAISAESGSPDNPVTPHPTAAADIDIESGGKRGKKKKRAADSPAPASGTNPPADLRFSLQLPPPGAHGDTRDDTLGLDDKFSSSAVANAMRKYKACSCAEALLQALDRAADKTFVDALLAYIDKKGLRDSAVYKAAQLDRRLFSKIVSDRHYKPSKDTAVALALALKLTLDEANDFLARAGYAFSHSNKKDIIVEYFFRTRIYDLTDINTVLYNLGQKIIGR